MAVDDSQAPTLDGVPTADPPSRPGHTVPESIGQYRVLGVLGQGGMGTVYKAEQRHPVRRTVAVKVVKLGMDTAEVMARFESERQALSRMDHPGIARVLDAGADDKGRPYFVMEYVPGVPITVYADREKLPLKERLDLFLQVCDAIAHAHSKAILHRDIKASNVLAFTGDHGLRIAKVIDFGVAKALTSDRLTDLTFNTQMGLAVGTYESMSPEQADGSPDVDARTDVYALGVLLYELLAGAKPLASNMANTADVEIRRIIRDVDPPRPSVKMTTLGKEGMTKAATDRRLAPAALSKELKSELEWIPMMCLRKERDRRYASPLLLAADVRNYLEGNPLLAGPDTARYRLGKLARRNKGKLAAAAMVLLVLLAGIAGTTYGLIRESKQRKAADTARIEAENRRKDEEAVVEFLNKDILAKAAPEYTGSAAASDLLVKTLIDPAIATVETRFKDQPLVRATVQETLAETLDALGQLDRSLKQAQAAMATRHELLGDDNPDTLQSAYWVASELTDLGRPKEAEPMLRDALARWQRLRGDDDPQTIRALAELGKALDRQARHAEAEPLLKQAWERARKVLGDDNDITNYALANYANGILAQQRFAEAEPLYKRAWESRQRTLGNDHPSTLGALGNYATLLLDQHLYARAAPLLKQGWDRDRQVLGDDHPDTIGARNYYIADLQNLGRLEEMSGPAQQSAAAAAARAEGDDLMKKHQQRDAEPAYLKAVALDRAAGDAGRIDLAADLLRLADSTESQGKTRLPDAITAAREAQSILQTDRPTTDPQRLDCGRKFAAMLNRAGSYPESIAVYHQVVADDDEGKVDRYYRTEDRTSLAKVLEKTNDLPAAEAVLKETLALRQASPKWGHTGKETQTTAKALAALLEKENKPQDAAAVRADAGLIPATTQPAK